MVVVSVDAGVSHEVVKPLVAEEGVEGAGLLGCAMVLGTVAEVVRFGSVCHELPMVLAKRHVVETG